MTKFVEEINMNIRLHDIIRQNKKYTQEQEFKNEFHIAKKKNIILLKTITKR